MEADAAVERARGMLSAARQSGVTLRLFGGLAIHLHCPSRQAAEKVRDYQDLDFVGYSRQSRKIRELLQGLGYEPNKHFNALHGAERLIFYVPGTEAHIDVVLDRLRMCHTIELGSRLELDSDTVSPVDLFLTKMQIVELNPKDVQDVLDLMLDHELADRDGDVMNMTRLLSLTSDDWGLYRTLIQNIDTLIRLAPQSGLQYEVANARLQSLLKAMQNSPKTWRWRMRAKVGERLPWYELPEEPRR